MHRDSLTQRLDKTLESLDGALLEAAGVRPEKYVRGKVRDIFDLGSALLILTTDRISAFDQVLTTIPCKGEVLNRVALFWFDKTAPIIKNHVKAQLSPRSMLVEKCRVVPLEVVVRGYLTGSAWRSYQKGDAISGIQLDSGLKYNQEFPEPILTPSTKEDRGHHDKPISREEILSEEIVPADLWHQIERTALALFEMGGALVGRQGLILVDTKYEFGLLDEELVLIDEIHTPDSSRYWYADTYEQLFAAGKAQRELDKEYFRRWLMDRGYMGEGHPPAITDEIRVAVAERYVRAYEKITGELFDPSSFDAPAEIKSIADKLEQEPLL